jgi:hypothetical protein
VEAAGRATGVDLEALEVALRGAALEAGARVLERLLEPVGVGRQETPVRCACGAVMQSLGVREKDVQTLLGTLRFSRSLYRCPNCGKTRCPGDDELGIERTSRSPGVQRQVARLGAKEPFREVAKDLDELAGVRLSRKDAERVSERIGAEMEQWQERERRALRLTEPPPPEAPKTIETLYVEFDGTGVSMVPDELAGRKGKQADGSAKTREAKLGCVFTQTALNDKGRPIRDSGTTTFVGAIENAQAFGERIFAEAVRRGLYQAKRVAVLGDGAEWVKNQAGTHFGHAQFIIDFYHASEHVTDLCRALFDRDLKRLNRYRDRWVDSLESGDIERLIDQAREFLPKDPKSGKDARTQIGYFEKNKEYMRYARFKAEGYFIGSGVIEAGCKTVIGQRLKQSGMEWTVRGANAIIALRCATLSGRAEDFWEQRAA